jgi:hypothetical protein
VHIIWQRSCKTILGGGNHEKGKEVWKCLWSLDVRKVVKTFMWRSFDNALPTRDNLYKRHVAEDPNYSICGGTAENIIHAIWSCPSARDVWGGGSSPFQKCTSHGAHFMQVFEECMARFIREELNFFAVLSRGIWLHRNCFLFEGDFTPPNVILVDASKSSEEFKRCHNASKVLVQNGESILAMVADRWYPPSSGFY